MRWWMDVLHDGDLRSSWCSSIFGIAGFVTSAALGITGFGGSTGFAAAAGVGAGLGGSGAFGAADFAGSGTLGGSGFYYGR